MADYLVALIRNDYDVGSLDAVCSVPLYISRQRYRTFNQAEILARAVSRGIGVPYINALFRKSYTGSQTALSAPARLRNVKASFDVRSPESVRSRHLLVIDDVMTTGATFLACANALKQADAASVSCASFARG
jgi:ComF family protein